MTLTDKRGKSRVRETIGYRKYFGAEKKTILFYKKPTNVKGTAFLTFDYPTTSNIETNKEDDQWLYLPALRKVRRISAADRGDYFLGTDFTYEDIKLEGRLSLQDYHFESLKAELLNAGTEAEINTILIRGIPKTDEISKELGYGKTEFWVDSETWIIVKANYWDTKNNLLKTLTASDIREVDGIITRHKMSIDNHKTGHHTDFSFTNVNYTAPVKDSLFSKRSMKKGK